MDIFGQAGGNTACVDMRWVKQYVRRICDVDYAYRNSLFSQTKRLSQRLRAHPAEDGTAWRFSVYAPSCRAASLVGSFNHWDPEANPMERAENAVWSVTARRRCGELYKFRFVSRDGQILYRADPCARYAELRPGTASRTWRDSYRWNDAAWRSQQMSRRNLSAPMAVYEVHLGSWRALTAENRLYRFAAAVPLAEYAADDQRDLSHIELMPIAEYPFDGSWGYQVTRVFRRPPLCGTLGRF